MERFHTYLLKEATIDLNKIAQKDKAQAERLEAALGKLHMMMGSVCGVKEGQPITDKIFFFSAPSGSATLTFDCGHTYHSATNVGVKPLCKVCLEKCEANVKANPAFWSVVAPEKTFTQTIKDKITGNRDKPDDKPPAPPAGDKTKDKKTT